jgi:hypothetical protein
MNRSIVKSNPNIRDIYPEIETHIVPELFEELVKYKKKPLSYNLNDYKIQYKPQYYHYIKNCLINNKRHLETCECMQGMFDSIYTTLFNNFIDKVCEERVNTRTEILIQMNQIESITYDLVLDECKEHQIVCIDEYEEIKELLEMFDTKYDLKDPRAVALISNVLSAKLELIRLEKESTFNGIIEKKTDKDGNVNLVLNPVTIAKKDFINVLNTTIEKLDKIFEGIKIQNASFEAKDLRHLFLSEQIIDTELIETNHID